MSFSLILVIKIGFECTVKSSEFEIQNSCSILITLIVDYFNEIVHMEKVEVADPIKRIRLAINGILAAYWIPGESS